MEGNEGNRRQRVANPNRELYDARGISNVEDVKLADGKSKYGIAPMHRYERSRESVLVAKTAREYQRERQIQEDQDRARRELHQPSRQVRGRAEDGESAASSHRRTGSAGTSRPSRRSRGASNPRSRARQGGEVVTKGNRNGSLGNGGGIPKVAVIIAVVIIVLLLVIFRPGCSA